MRSALRELVGLDRASAGVSALEVPDHLGLAYEVWAPVKVGGAGREGQGKVPVNEHYRDDWLQKLAGHGLPVGYERAFDRWRSGFSPNDRLAFFELTSRLLVGHGNPSATDVGLTVHHTWGVPIIPGSALKGLLTHYVDATLGPDGSAKAPYQWPEGEQRKRARYQGPTFEGGRIMWGPGDVHRGLFGAPDADDDRRAREYGQAGAARGRVVFHDALYVPPGQTPRPGGQGTGRGNTPPGRGRGGKNAGKAEGAGAGEERPFTPDVLTVHQKKYYDAQRGKPWPNDYDDPNPVGFLTVAPGATFLLALSGPPEWVRLTEGLLVEALGSWGVGGKTSAGYGRGKVEDDRGQAGRWFSPRARTAPTSSNLNKFLSFLRNPQPGASGGKVTNQELIELIERQWLPHLLELDEAELGRAKKAIGDKIKRARPNVERLRDALLDRLTRGGR